MWLTPTMSGFWVIGVEGESGETPARSRVCRCLSFPRRGSSQQLRASLAVGTDSLGTMIEIDLAEPGGVPISDIIRAATSGGAELLGPQSTVACKIDIEPTYSCSGAIL